MLRLFAKDFRCFKEIDVPIAPLTLLVGENSTGKSTFLALFRIAWNVAFGQTDVNFNELPFALGAYDDIAHNPGRRASHAKEFVVGARVVFPKRKGIYSNIDDKWLEFTGIFDNLQGHPSLQKRDVSYERHTLSTKRVAAWHGWDITIATPGGDVKLDIHGGPHRILRRTGFPPVGWILQWSRSVLRSRGGKPKVSRTTLQKSAGINLLEGMVHDARNVFGETTPWALSPIRSEPQRVYSPMANFAQPSGGHVPHVMERLSREFPEDWEDLRKGLVEFGEMSGMFDDLEIAFKGENENDPFQIHVKVQRQKKSRNLMDVGYGVSQILPILVAAIYESEDRWLLMQQPEVHLHPKAQAALGSVLAALVKKADRRFIVETHSDYLIDRVSMEIRDKKLSDNSVMILYFEPKGTSVRVHPIKFDKQGNLLDAPSGFRTFFLEEQKRYLGI